MYICLMLFELRANMIFSKTSFFAILFLAVAIPFSGRRLLWLLHSSRAPGVVGFEGRGTAGEQLQTTYTYCYYWHGQDTVWFNAPGGMSLREGEAIPVRYDPAELRNARINSFIGIWGDLLVYNGIPELIILICFFHPAVVPWHSKLRVTWRKPFIFVYETR